MAFRTLEISAAAEIHIKNNQLLVTTGEGDISVPIEDLTQIIVHGSNIRLSTMDLSILSQNNVVLTTLDNKYLPTAIVLPYEGNSRQAKMMHAQIRISEAKRNDLWLQIVKKKIENQATALSILELSDSGSVAEYVDRINTDNIDSIEALSAKEYFSHYHGGLNRRKEAPVNSRLNYGYAVVRSAIARSLVLYGFHTAFGLHHDNQFNAFNLSDDLIEPYRAIVDLAAYEDAGNSIILSRTERKMIAHVLHNACSINDMKTNVLTSIEIMCESLKRIILDGSDETLMLPDILPIESMEGISE